MELTEIIMALLYCGMIILLCIFVGVLAAGEIDRRNDNEIDLGINQDCEERRQFHRDAAVYFENGLIHEIYNTKDYSICNFANDSYVLMMYPFSYRTRMYDRKHGTLGLFFDNEVYKRTDQGSWTYKNNRYTSSGGSEKQYFSTESGKSSYC